MNLLSNIFTEATTSSEAIDKWEKSFCYSILLAAIITLLLLQL